MLFAAVHESGYGRFCCKSLFSLYVTACGNDNFLRAQTPEEAFAEILHEVQGRRIGPEGKSENRLERIGVTIVKSKTMAALSAAICSFACSYGGAGASASTITTNFSGTVTSYILNGGSPVSGFGISGSATVTVDDVTGEDYWINGGWQTAGCS